MPELFIGGAWVTAMAGARRDIICPADGQRVAIVDESDATDTEAAIAAARAAFDAGHWSEAPAVERGALLLRVAHLLERDREDLARAESLDTGKRLARPQHWFRP